MVHTYKELCNVSPTLIPIEVIPTHNMQNSKLKLKVSRTFRRPSEGFGSSLELLAGSSSSNGLGGDPLAS